MWQHFFVCGCSISLDRCRSPSAKNKLFLCLDIGKVQCKNCYKNVVWLRGVYVCFSSLFFFSFFDLSAVNALHMWDSEIKTKIECTTVERIGRWCVCLGAKYELYSSFFRVSMHTIELVLYFYLSVAKSMSLIHSCLNSFLVKWMCYH